MKRFSLSNRQKDRLKKEFNRKLEELRASFEKQLESGAASDVKINETIKIDSEIDTKDRATLIITTKAYAKIMCMVAKYNTEVAWHGIIVRGQNDMEYILKDIIVYDQYVTGATVNTDQLEYTEFLEKLDDETINNLNYQGHSHVNMATSPSGTDKEHQSKITKILRKDAFYVFQIWNKSMSIYTIIYDRKYNTIFEQGDIDVCIVDTDGESINEFLIDSSEKIKNKTPAKVETTKKTETKSYSFKDDKPYYYDVFMDDYYYDSSHYRERY